MKTLKLIVFGMTLLLAGTMQGQISFNVHFGTPPQWGPEGYSDDDGYSDVRYYYLPDVEAYYDVQNSMFIYMSGNRWVRRSYLPDRYRDYDLYNGYKVVMKDYRGNTPYTHFREYRSRYGRGYRGQEQRNIGMRPGRENSREINRPYENSNRNQGYERNVRPDNVRNERPANVRNEGRGNNRNEGRGNDKKEGRGNDKKEGRGND